MSEDYYTDSFIDSFAIESSITAETRSFMSQMLDFPSAPAIPISTSKERGNLQNLTVGPSSSIHLSPIIPALITLIERIQQDLESNISRLLSLNPSRREAIAQHLERLSGNGHLSATQMEKPDPTGGLRKWIDSPKSPSQLTALKTYFEELALIALGQALLLKGWSDRGVRKWSEGDLGRLNWALSSALKPHVPLDREGWQITRPNLYSWYNPTPTIQHEIWSSFESWKFENEGPGFFAQVFSPARRSHSETFEPSGYDSRFYKCLWEQMGSLGINTSPDSSGLKRNKVIFSPTLRDGTLVRSGPQSVTWIGLEASPFSLMMAELKQIWWGPAPPPYWALGTGLEVHARDQLALALASSKPSVISRISEMEACDLAFVLEEQTVRTQGKNIHSVRYREQVEQLPYFKKLRSSGTSLGDLQACVAISKLRPGGALWWAREEALNSKDGNSMLNFILDRAKLCCEWDMSELEHSLPQSIPLFPKYLYLFIREADIDTRLTHRPVRHIVQGQMRSHVELSLVLEDALQSATHAIQPRGHWKVISHVSPTSQKEWLEKWPDPAAQSVIRQLDKLRTESLPLANFTTIRSTPDGNPATGGGWSVHSSLKGFWLTAEYHSDGRRLSCRNLPREGQEQTGSGFLVLIPDETWIAPLEAYFTSEHIQKWLDCHAERRGDKWVINEQVVKWLPVPQVLLNTLGISRKSQNAGNDLSPLASQHSGESARVSTVTLTSQWEKLASEIPYQPGLVKQELLKISEGSEKQQIHATLFVKTARVIDNLKSSQNRLFSMITPEGKIRWKEMIEVLPRSECVAISLHPRIRLSGTLPPHLPIQKIDRVKAPTHGILLATESGFALHVGSDNSLLVHILWDQLQGLQHPTWSELLQYLRLPRRVELAESTALDILRSYEEQSLRLKELQDLLAACQLF